MHFQVLFNHMFQRAKAGVQKFGHNVAVAANFISAVAPNICAPSGWTLLNITFLDPRIFRWLLGASKICTTFI